MKLFAPDNFSNYSINYKKISTPNFIIPVISRYFKQSTIKSVSQLNRAEINSENYKVVLTIKNKAQTVLIRKHKFLHSPATINFYLNLLLILKNKGLTVSQPLLNLNHAACTSVDNQKFSVFEFIDSDYFKPSEKIWSAVAKNLGFMHKIFNNLPAPIINKIKKSSSKNSAYYNQIKSTTDTDFLSLKKIIKSKTSLSKIDRIVLLNLSDISNLASFLSSYLPLINRLPKKLIHSDIHPHNILTKNNQIKAIIDFDSLRLAPQSIDVAMAIYRLGRQFFINSKKNPKMASLLTRKFLLHYSKINPLSENEYQLLPLIIKNEFLIKLLFVLKLVYINNNQTWINDLHKFIIALKEIDYFWPNNIYEK